MGVLGKFRDGIVNLNNMLANRRSAHSNNVITADRISYDEMRAIYRTGIGSKIIRLKTGIALDNTLTFESESDKEYYETRLQYVVKKAAKFQLAFGRALVVLHEVGADLSQPLGQVDDWSSVKYHVFSGDMVTVPAVSLDLSSPKYFTPTVYSVRGYAIHPSRCVDFKYIDPVEHDAPVYQYGGISEYELIRNELVADSIVQRAVPAMLEKSSSMFYKVNGFKDLLRDRREGDLITYFTELENLRSIYGAGIVDAEDEIQVHSQGITNLAESDLVTLRRLAMVTGLPLSWLVGEAARGLNSTGEGERQVLQQTIETYQSDYLLECINRLMELHGRGNVRFKPGAIETDAERVAMEAKIIDNAMKLWSMGEDYAKYLQENGVVEPDNFGELFGETD